MSGFVFDTLGYSAIHKAGPVLEIEGVSYGPDHCYFHWCTDRRQYAFRNLIVSNLAFKFDVVIPVWNWCLIVFVA